MIGATSSQATAPQTVAAAACVEEASTRYVQCIEWAAHESKRAFPADEKSIVDCVSLSVLMMFQRVMYNILNMLHMSRNTHFQRMKIVS